MRHLYLLLFFITHLAYSQTDSLQTIELANVIISENRIQTPFSETARNIHIITPQDIQQTPGAKHQRTAELRAGGRHPPARTL